MRRLLRLNALTIAAIAVIGLAVACGGSKSSGSSFSSAASTPGATRELVKIRWGGPNNTKTGFPTGVDGYGIKTGVFTDVMKKYGFDLVSYSPFPNGPPAIDALQSGSIDLVSVGDAPAINSRANGIDTVAIMQSGFTSDIWIIGKRNGPKTYDDLKGKKVGVAFGSNADYYIRAVLKEKGLTSSVNLVNLASIDAPAALERGDIDANAFFSQNAGGYEDRGFAIIDKASVTHPDGQSTSVVLVKPDTLKKYANLPEAWYKAHQAALDAARKSPDDFYKWEADLQGLPLDFQKAIDPLNSDSRYPNEPFPKKPFESLSRTKQYLLEAGLARKDFSTADWFAAAKKGY